MAVSPAKPRLRESQPPMDAACLSWNNRFLNATRAGLPGRAPRSPDRCCVAPTATRDCRKSIPCSPRYKQYTELCEPGGARFLPFGVDPDFNSAVDGLIEVDLACFRPKKRERYVGGSATCLPRTDQAAA